MKKKIKSMVNGVLVDMSDDEAAEFIASMPTFAVAPDSTLPLQPYQFWAMLEIAEKAQDAIDAVSAIEDARERAIAQAKLDRLPQFIRDDPLIAFLIPALKLSDKKFDKMWEEASKF